MAKIRSEDAGKEVTKISQESKIPPPAEEEETVDITELDERIAYLEELAAHFSKFIDEAAPIIDGHEARLIAIEKAIKDLADHATGLATAINKFNVELSKLTGDLYRYGNENNDYHLTLAKAINDLVATLPSAVDKIILDYAAKAEEEEKAKEQEPAEKQ